MMKLWLLIFGVLYGVMRGFGEGMVMNFPGVREHYAISFYHLARTLEALSLIAATISWGLINVKWWFLGGALILMWEAFEVAYFITRDGQASFGHENFLGVFAFDSAAIAFAIHLLRIITGIWCLNRGRT